METAIGVFAQRDRAEEAVKNLLEQGVPKDSIVYLSRSEREASSIGKELGAYVGGLMGGAAGMSAGVVAATALAIPGVGAVFALGFGAAALLGLVGAGTGAAVGQGAAHDSTAPSPTTGDASAEDSAYFREVLNEGHSLIVVRTDSPQVAATACQILNQFGMSMKKGASQKAKVTTRELGDAVAVDVVGKIALGEGSGQLRGTIRELMDKGKKHIVLNLAGVDFIDSSGLGELVRTHASVRTHGGQLKLANPSKHVHDLLKMTKIDRVLDIEQDEASALNSFDPGHASAQVAG
ncbi:MAG TPA: STAS domain-containing protein [Candidatus Acidoferrum sp.]|jgi:anti-sigma B factor antagonist|nr:STAS domain-containing protein [Candidatus Acidoferrum sp.]